nr:4-oxalocrotonate tautomerase [Paracidovorax oryzae]
MQHGAWPASALAARPAQGHPRTPPRPCRRYDRRTVVFAIQRNPSMPTYHIEMMEGRTVEQKKKLVEEITRVSVEILGGSPESVDILITDVKRENWATGGKLWSERQ